MIPAGQVSLNKGQLYIPQSFDVDDWEWVNGEVVDHKDGTWEIILWPREYVGDARAKVSKAKGVGSGHTIAMSSWFKKRRPLKGYYPAEMIDGCLCVDIEAGLTRRILL